MVEALLIAFAALTTAVSLGAIVCPTRRSASLEQFASGAGLP
jgi:hypothetical protein